MYRRKEGKMKVKIGAYKGLIRTLPFVAKTVEVESANQFSFEEVCRTQYSLKYFSKSYRPADHLEKHYAQS